MRVVDTPLCRGGHLPHKRGDRLSAPTRATIDAVGESRLIFPIFRLVGEMSALPAKVGEAHGITSNASEAPR